MWLPTPVYERLPQFYFLVGLLFFANGLYVGFEFTIAFAYIAFGVWSSIWGIGIYVMRKIKRADPVTVEPTAEDSPADATPAT